VNRAAPPSDGTSTDDIQPERRSVRPETVPDLDEMLGIPGPGATAPLGADLELTTDGDRPWSSSQFWIVQLIVLALYLIRLAVTLDFHLAVTSPGLEFSTFVLFVVPVVYAALHYGFRGAMLTSSWVTVLALPRFFVAAGNHQ
jgi:hypothetical protein